MGISGTLRNNDPHYYMSKDEIAAFQWISENIPPNSVFVASPQLGNILPGQTNTRVVYGHPFETVDAVRQELKINNYYRGELHGEAARKWFTANEVGYVIFGDQRTGNR